MFNKRLFFRTLALPILTLALVGCTANWIAVALKDLPVLIQIASNIVSLVAVAEGQPVSASDQAAVQNIGAQAGQDLTLIQTLYNDYKANTNATTLQKIQDAIATADQNLPALLQAAHIANPKLAAQVTAAIDLILTTVDTFSALIPAPSPAQASARRLALQGAKPLNPAQLRAAWFGITGVPLR